MKLRWGPAVLWMCLSCALPLAGCADFEGTPESLALDALLAADRSGQPLPSVKALAPDLDIAGAYRIQKALVAAKFGEGRPSGYKAGFTTQAMRDAFELSAPTAGVLPPDGRLEGEISLRLSDFRLLWLETEVAFEIGRPIDEALADLDAAKAAISSLRPAVELPDVTLASIDPLRAEDVVAANMLSKNFLVGPPVDPSFDLSGLRISVTRDGETFHEYDGSGVEELWPGVLWAINHSLAEGYPVEAGMIILGGTLGRPHPAPVGTYRADYGELGELVFHVR